MKRWNLHYTYAGRNACGGNARFEAAVRRYARDHQDELARLRARQASGEPGFDAANADASIARAVRDGILAAGGYAEDDAVARDLPDLCWEIRGEDLCPCGQRLHYPDPWTGAQIAALVEELGEEVPVIAEGQEYAVSRHYIALHGLKAADLPALAARGIVRRVPER